MAEVDLSGLMNPKRVMSKREREAEEAAMREMEAKRAQEDTILATGIKFEKGRTKEERAAQQAKLAEALRKRKP